MTNPTNTNSSDDNNLREREREIKKYNIYSASFFFVNVALCIIFYNDVCADVDEFLVYY